MTEPIPSADEADLAEQSRSVDDDVDENDSLTADYDSPAEADIGDVLEQRLAVSDGEDERRGD
ncbi:MAG: hypothetical protein HYZ38_28105 [Mycobacterium sp.]|nr:hypothetical protein [Mycobacterium sp.]